jgi:hypothetical protein
MRTDRFRKQIKSPWGLLIILALLSGASLVFRPALVRAVSDGLTYLPVVNRGPSQAEGGYVVIGWNDLGMHCYDRDYSTSAVLPPYNNLWAQVIKRGDPPEIITTAVTVEYSFPDNTDSTTKTNFWNYAQKLFGVSLAPNVGLAGKGLSGQMDPSGDHFVAEGVPITEFSDSNPNAPDYFQLARIVAKDSAGTVLASTGVVAPVSSEMRCDVCHNSPSPTNFRMNILMKHDEEENTTLAQQASSGNPVLCASCHADPALGAPGKPDVMSLSSAMHKKHDEETSNCYACHPGPQTQCLRDVMSVQAGMTCTDCHEGGMTALGNNNRTPWVDLPRCGNCHDSQYAENQGKLYKVSTGHGGLYCESCHNSTHAILTSREPKDNQQSMSLQGKTGTIRTCTVCHLTKPTSGGPHSG